MRLVSFNFRQGGLSRPYNPWLELLRGLKADVVCAQETVPPSRFPEGAAAACGQHLHALVPHGQWGSALVHRGLAATEIPVPGFEGWVVGAKLQATALPGPWSGVNVFSVHMPPPYARRTTELIEVIVGLADADPLILAGDFNLTTAAQRETSPANMRRTARLLERMRRELGLLNAWQLLHPSKEPPQTLRWSAKPEIAYHCDGVFIDARLARSVVAAEVLQGPIWSALSDHNPVVVDFD